MPVTSVELRQVTKSLQTSLDLIKDKTDEIQEESENLQGVIDYINAKAEAAEEKP